VASTANRDDSQRHRTDSNHCQKRTDGCLKTDTRTATKAGNVLSRRPADGTIHIIQIVIKNKDNFCLSGAAIVGAATAQ
jgi:hypothetical protein